MKFLCVPCDKPMRLDKTTGPDEGSITLVYACDECGYEAAMLTNAHETQMVSSLGVKIGAASEEGEGKTSGSKCPFTGMVQGMTEEQVAGVVEAHAESAGPADASGFPWTQEAEQRLESIPTFLRPMAKTGIEKFAKDKGYAEVDAQVLTEARAHFGM